MNDALQQIDAALAALVAAGCRRDRASGQWLTAAGLILESDPREAARALRREKVKTELEKQRCAITGAIRMTR